MINIRATCWESLPWWSHHPIDQRQKLCHLNINIFHTSKNNNEFTVLCRASPQWRCKWQKSLFFLSFKQLCRFGFWGQKKILTVNQLSVFLSRFSHSQSSCHIRYLEKRNYLLNKFTENLKEPPREFILNFSLKFALNFARRNNNPWFFRFVNKINHAINQLDMNFSIVGKMNLKPYFFLSLFIQLK